METTATPSTTFDAGERAREAFEMLGRRDLSKADELWGPDSVDHFLPVGAYQGTEAIRGYFEGLFAAFPEFTLEVEDVVAQDNRAVVQWRGTGTFSGAPFLGIQPTGRRVEMRGVDVIEFDDQGRIAHNTIYYDGAEFARQVGMLPRRDSTGDRLLTTMFNGATKLRAAVQRR
ncbi:MAG: ester cyclase [Actinomycetota bacterium]|nr:ester cyclase [Actinomycetota bacterium]